MKHQLYVVDNQGHGMQCNNCGKPFHIEYQPEWDEKEKEFCHTYNIYSILRLKKQGIDCDESGSAEIKQIVKEIINLFPIEYSEACEELDNG